MKNSSTFKRTLPRKVPQSYRELYDVYRPQIVEVATKLGIPVTEVLDKLRTRRVIEGFDVEAYIPDTFSWDEAVAFLGLTDGRWHDALKKASIPVHRGRRGSLPWSSVRPWALRGGNGNGPAMPWDMEAVYWGSDILRVADFLDANGLARKTPECARLESAFRRRVGWFLSSFKVTAPAKPAIVEPKPIVEEIVSKPLDIPEDAWPKDLPHDQKELVKMYGPYVFDQVRRVSTIKTEQELEEINQQVWVNIIQSDVLGKFMEAARTKLPRTLTLAEALKYLGITHKQWVNAVSYHQRIKAWMPTPVKGTLFGKDALYLTTDIQTLDESGFLKGRRTSVRNTPGVTGRGFKSYLAKAVQNHFKNLLRTRFRRHKERPLDPKVALATDGSGLSHKAAIIEDSTCWEDHLTDSSREPDMEGLLDLALQLRRYGVDPNSQQGLMVLDHMTRGVTLRQALKLEGRQLVMTATA